MTTGERVSALIGRVRALFMQRVPGMITCEEFETFVQDYLDDELSARQKSIFEIHLLPCRACREYLAAYERSVELGRRVFDDPSENTPEEVPKDLIRAIVESRGG